MREVGVQLSLEGVTISVSIASEDVTLSTFFNSVWGDAVGFACIASRPPNSESFQEQWFSYPDEAQQLFRYIDSLTQYDVWYCPQLFIKKQRRKEFVKCCRVLWSDLDGCHPDKLLRQPTVSIQSSPGRYQALWAVLEPIDPEILEQYSKRIAYHHAPDGADKSGWDLTQLLRVPSTRNFKYDEIPIVHVYNIGPYYNQLSDFNIYPELTDEPTKEQYAFPTGELPDFNEILYRRRLTIHPAVYVLVTREPAADWSKALWQLETMLFEGQLTREEVYVIVSGSSCNKYERDGRGELVLWREVCRAGAHVEAKGLGLPDDTLLGPMLTEAERAAVKQAPSIVKDYISMATEMTDASVTYHQAGIFTLLSAILSGNLCIEADYGEIMPNLWFLILADTTLTRKTTSMDIAMDVLFELDEDAVLATDGSIEGMVSAMAGRSGKCSIFLRDEFSGLMEMMVKKDHYAGMLETFAKLYDGKPQKKILRRQTIDIKKPVFLIYAGGIKSRILELLNSHHIDSGFLPRFILLSADADLGALRPLGPKRSVVQEKRTFMVERLKRIKEEYGGMQILTIGGVQVPHIKKTIAELTPEAWSKFQYYEALMNHDAANSPMPEYLTPTFVRLTISGLKAAVLLAAARCSEAGQPLEVDEVDILEAFSYVEEWRKTAYEIVMNIGRSAFEVHIERVVKILKGSGGVVPRGVIMRKLKLTAKTAHDLLETMEQRNIIVRSKAEKSEFVTLTEG